MISRRRRMMMAQQVPLWEHLPVQTKGVVDGAIQDDWSQIIKNCKAGKAKEFYSVGDHKSITVSGTTFDMDYLGQGLDVRADGKNSSNLTTWLARTVPWACKWNTSNTTSGGWAASNIRNYCRTTVYNGLPAEVRSAIVEVTKTDNDYYGASSVIDTVWIPSREEVNAGLYKERFSDDASRKKTGAYSSWWLRSAGDSSLAYRVTSSGNPSSYYGANYTYGVVPGFCI